MKVFNFTIGESNNDFWLPNDKVVELPLTTTWDDIVKMTHLESDKSGHITNGWHEHKDQSVFVFLWKWTDKSEMKVDLRNHKSKLLDW